MSIKRLNKGFIAVTVLSAWLVSIYLAGFSEGDKVYYSAAPEPSVLFLMTIGFVGLGVVRKSTR